MEDPCRFSGIPTKTRYHRKEQVDEKIVEQLEFKTDGNNKEYKVEDICNSTVYGKELEVGHLSDLYHLISFKGYLQE